MSNKIIRLPESVINQIAAGEVVENPASIIKELIENSLDAGATQIDISIVAGGQQLIRIEDDGCGMSPEDALLCLERHATSKIRNVEDLSALSTMGFRGEALAAIASVSHFELRTSNAVATRVLAEGGQVKEVEPCARNRGTTIEVRSLFYNVPARKKFQKSQNANVAQATRIVETLALAHPEVGFSLNSNGRSVFEVKKGNQKKRIDEVLGEYEHEVKSDDICGFVAAPAKAMSTRTGQYLFINRRPIFSPLIAKAVKEAFGTRIAEHSYPPFVLFLEIAPDSVDVNVHPQKREVRFRDDKGIFRMVQEAVCNVFSAPLSFAAPVSFTPPLPAFSFAEEYSSPSFLVPETTPNLDLTFSDRFLTVFGSYLLIQRENLILVDLRAAHARVLFESLKKEKGLSQSLIWPLEIPLLRGEEQIEQELNELGIECRVLQRTLVVDALPQSLDAADFPDFFAKWKEEKNVIQATTRFCRSMKKNYRFEEAQALWRRLQKCQDVQYDPMGNRIWVEIKESDLGSFF